MTWRTWRTWRTMFRQWTFLDDKGAWQCMVASAILVAISDAVTELLDLGNSWSIPLYILAVILPVQTNTNTKRKGQHD